MTSGPHQSEQTQGAGSQQHAGAPGPGPDPTVEEQAVTDRDQQAQPDAQHDMAEDTPNDLVADLAEAQARVASLTDDLKRLQAEYVNYKRRVDRDRGLVLENAKFSVLSSLLPVLDDLDRARQHGELEGGFKAVADALERIVAGQGLVKFGKPGDEFDPNYHEALMHSHSPDVTTTTCRDIVSAGWQIGERVVRPAQVTVVDPEPTTESPSADAPAEAAAGDEPQDD